MRISDWSSDLCSSYLRCVIRRSSLASAVVGISGTTSVEKFYITIAAAIRFPEKIRIIQCLHISPMRWHVYCCLLLVWSARFVRGGSGKPGPFFYLTLISTLRGKPASSRSEEHTSELQSLMRISYAVSCLKKKKKNLYH